MSWGDYWALYVGAGVAALGVAGFVAFVIWLVSEMPDGPWDIYQQHSPAPGHKQREYLRRRAAALLAVLRRPRAISQQNNAAPAHKRGE